MKRTIYIVSFLLFTTFVLNSCKDEDCQKTEWREDCSCTADYNPVCGCDGNTYSNACTADCQGIEVIAEGECAAGSYQ